MEASKAKCGQCTGESCMTASIFLQIFYFLQKRTRRICLKFSQMTRFTQKVGLNRHAKRWLKHVAKRYSCVALRFILQFSLSCNIGENYQSSSKFILKDWSFSKFSRKNGIWFLWLCLCISLNRSSRPEVFCKKGVLRNFCKIHRKTPVSGSLSW